MEIETPIASGNTAKIEASPEIKAPVASPVIKAPVASGNTAKIEASPEIKAPVASPVIKAPVASGNRIDGHVADLNLKTNGRTAASQPAASSQPAPTTQSAGDRSVQVAANQPQSAQTNQTGGLVNYSKTVQGLGTGGIAAIMAGLVAIAWLKRSPLDQRSVERRIGRRLKQRNKPGLQTVANPLELVKVKKAGS